MYEDPKAMPEIMSLNPAELIEWCNARKKTLGLSNQRLAELTMVPQGTIDRIMAGKYTEFRYSSIQPIVALLVGFHTETPVPDSSDAQQPNYYYETIEGYKLIVENKNHEIEELGRNLEILKKEIEYLKCENTTKQQTIESLQQHTSWLQKLFDGLLKAKGVKDE